MQAQLDIAKGTLNVAFADRGDNLTFGDYTEILRMRYGVGMVVYSFPKSFAAEEAWVRGYNEEVIPRIQQQFGSNVLKEAMREARNQYETRMAERRARIASLRKQLPIPVH